MVIEESCMRHIHFSKARAFLAQRRCACCGMGECSEESKVERFCRQRLSSPVISESWRAKLSATWQSDERLEIRPRREVEDVQDGLGDLELQLRKLERSLRTLRSHLAEPDPRKGSEGSPSLESELAVAIDCLLADDIRPAIGHLESAARLTPESLQDA